MLGFRVFRFRVWGFGVQSSRPVKLGNFGFGCGVLGYVMRVNPFQLLNPKP